MLVDSYLLSTTTRRSVVDLMPMIGARYYTHLDTTQLQCDVLESELAKEMENGRLCRLLVKLATINERPESVLMFTLSPPPLFPLHHSQLSLRASLYC